MPTKKNQIAILLSDEEHAWLLAIWSELRSPARRGRPEYLPKRVTFNQWLVRLALERAQQLARNLK